MTLHPTYSELLAGVRGTALCLPRGAATRQPKSRALGRLSNREQLVFRLKSLHDMGTERARGHKAF